VTVDAVWVAAAAFVPLVAVWAVLVLWPREWAIDLLDATVDDRFARLRDGTLDWVALEADRARCDEVSASFAPPWVRDTTRRWDWPAVWSYWLVTRRSPLFAEVGDAVPDELDGVVGRALLRSSTMWWMWAVGAAVGAAAADRALLRSPQRLRAEVRDRAGVLAARHRARLELLDVDTVTAAT
jgi:hypothetical protein